MSVSTPERDALKAAVDRGVAFLDETYPDWRGKVKKDLLDMGDVEDCVLAQGSGTRDFDHVIKPHDYEWADERGFYVNSTDSDYYKPRYEVLTELWKEIL